MGFSSVPTWKADKTLRRLGLFLLSVSKSHLSPLPEGRVEGAGRLASAFLMPKLPGNRVSERK
jgi:hypothetical protein